MEAAVKGRRDPSVCEQIDNYFSLVNGTPTM